MGKMTVASVTIASIPTLDGFALLKFGRGCFIEFIDLVAKGLHGSIHVDFILGNDFDHWRIYIAIDGHSCVSFGGKELDSLASLSNNKTNGASWDFDGSCDGHFCFIVFF